MVHESDVRSLGQLIQPEFLATAEVVIDRQTDRRAAVRLTDLAQQMNQRVAEKARAAGQKNLAARERIQLGRRTVCD